jgi:tetratricopeptide (TPR) repeat protein
VIVKFKMRAVFARGLQAIILMGMCACSACHSLSGESSLHRAEELSGEGRYEEAIAAYREHIDDRLALERPDWENPYFYLLRVGDLQLAMEQPEAALGTFAEAEQQQVDSELVLDRYRSVAHWYVDHGMPQEAFDLLKTHRQRDSLLFDALLDRVGRSLVEKESLGSGVNQGRER